MSFPDLAAESEVDMESSQEGSSKMDHSLDEKYMAMMKDLQFGKSGNSCCGRCLKIKV